MLDYLTYRDAAIAVVRLYESDESVAIRTAEYLLEKVKETPGAKEIIEKAYARREAIRSSKTEIVKSSEYIPGKTYTGTAYYLSNKGDDSNSGTSEKSPWKTIDRLQETYDVKKHLSNLQYFPALEYAENPMDPYKVFLKSDYNSDTSSWEYITGDLYLRCDEGNPGEVFSDIQMSTPSSMFDGVKNYCTVDNLCVAYSIQTLCGGGDPNDGPNHHVTFQNCEAKWMGGGVYYYRDDYHAYMMCGGAFNCSGSNETVLNCYAHHCFQEGVTLEAFDYYDGMIENIRFEGNLTEYCLMGNMFTNWDTSNRESHLFKDVIYRDNMVLYSGFENLYTMKKDDRR